jgi:uncharacterized protein YbjT (DUF2867 family)
MKLAPKPMQHITIFGGTGFIGRHLVRRLAKTGATIRIATRDPERVLPLKPNGNVGQIIAWPCNLHDDKALARAMADTDVVINLVGILYERGKNTFQKIHIDLPRRIAAIAHKQDVQKLIHVSAIGANANSAAKYARSKAAGEQAVLTEFPGATILRPSIIFGPEDGFFNLFATLAKFTPALPLVGGGHTKFQPVYVGDVTDAIATVVASDQPLGKIYELGGPAIYSFKQLLELMLQETGQQRCLLSLPFGLAKFQALFLQLLPKPLLTPDQVELLKQDNVVADQALTLRNLGITPTAVETIIPTYLDRYRAGGRFGHKTV